MADWKLQRLRGKAHYLAHTHIPWLTQQSRRNEPRFQLILLPSVSLLLLGLMFSVFPHDCQIPFCWRFFCLFFFWQYVIVHQEWRIRGPAFRRWKIDWRVWAMVLTTELQKCMEQMTCLGVEKTPKILKITNTTTSNYIRHLNWGFIDWKSLTIWIYLNSNINVCFENHRYFKTLTLILDLRFFFFFK